MGRLNAGAAQGRVEMVVRVGEKECRDAEKRVAVLQLEPLLRVTCHSVTTHAVFKISRPHSRLLDLKICIDIHARALRDFRIGVRRTVV